MVDAPTAVTPPPAAPAPAGRPARPLRSRYVAAVLLVLAALSAALFWSFAVNEAVGARLDRFTRGAIPGPATVWVHPGTWYVYATNGSTIDSIQVTGPGGRLLPVGPTAAVDTMAAGGGTGLRAVGQFTVPVPEVGNAQVTVTGTDTTGQGWFAVGDFDANRFQTFQLSALTALVVVNAATALAIVVVPIVRARRSSGKRPPAPPDPTS